MKLTGQSEVCLNAYSLLQPCVVFIRLHNSSLPWKLQTSKKQTCLKPLLFLNATVTKKEKPWL